MSQPRRCERSAERDTFDDRDGALQTAARLTGLDRRLQVVAARPLERLVPQDSQVRPATDGAVAHLAQLGLWKQRAAGCALLARDHDSRVQILELGRS